MRDIFGRVKVTMAWGVEWEIHMGLSAVTPAVGVHSTEVPECPSRDRCCAWDISRVCLEEVDLVQGITVAYTSQQSEEDQQNRSCHEKQARKAQCCS